MTAQPRLGSPIPNPVGDGYTIVRSLYGPQPERRAREAMLSVLAWVGMKDDLFEAELAVDELVTNARKHGRPPYELRVYLSAVNVKIAVVDGGTDHADLAQRLCQTTAGEPTPGESGRGLQLVAGLFPNRCGAEQTTTCVGLAPAKQVWITLPRNDDHPEGERRDATE